MSRFFAVEDVSSGSDSDYSRCVLLHLAPPSSSAIVLIRLCQLGTAFWISWFLSSKGNEYFCQVDEDFILDRFNLTGLNSEVANYNQALELITDQLDDDVQEELRGSLDTQARLLYGLIHARWIVTTRGLAKMVEKYKRGDFGRCPRVLCQSQSLLPVGLIDTPFEKSVKLFCGRCEDLYSPKSSRHGAIDGAYFGTTFPHLLFLVGRAPGASLEARTAASGGSVSASASASSKRRREREREELMEALEDGEGVSTASVALKTERYRPKIYGFLVHETAKLQRWQEAVRDRQVTKLETLEART
ncbi:Casein kinase II subunit beta [Mycena kentingensis (nom. inval.)]|nr:Casein kinase II subunit beta [Mycena kentingensis (nom. inval.)]